MPYASRVAGKPFLDSLTFEVRYAFGQTYLDRCGQTLVDIERLGTGWITGDVNPNGGNIENPATDCAIQFDTQRFAFTASRIQGNLRAMAAACATTWDIVRANLALNEFVRVIDSLKEDARIAPFVTEGEAWLRATLEGLAKDVGGGKLSAEVVSIAQGACWQKIFSDFFFDLATRSVFMWSAEPDPAGGRAKVRPNTELATVASRLRVEHRQSMLACYELAAREAQIRPKSTAALPAWFVEEKESPK